MSRLPFEMQVRIASALVEGTSIRSVERQLGVHRDTIMRFGVKAGEACAELHDSLVRDLHSTTIQLDEAWSFVFKKQKRVRPDDPPERGDQYTFIATDANTKLAITWLVGKRTAANTCIFANDLRARVLGRPQITSDGFRPYVDALDRAFGSEMDYAMLVKMYAEDHPGGEAARRYSPGQITGTQTTVIAGYPDPAKINTSYSERANLTLRMQQRRFTRLTNGFSKKARNLRAAVSLHMAWYNWCRVHETLRVTPAMAAGLTDHVWSIAELLLAALPQDASPSAQSGGSLPPASPRKPPGLLSGRPVVSAPWLRVIDGGA
jgi:hypothetical protein